MKTTDIKTCLQNKTMLQVQPDMQVSLEITHNPLHLPLDCFFLMAARVNKKRGFLFVSKLLGKHIPVHPLLPLLTSGLMAIQYFEETTGKEIMEKEAISQGLLSNKDDQIKEAYELLSSIVLEFDRDPIIIGFAETATALGQAFFDRIERAFYICTTRENVEGLNAGLQFEEEHSHAVDQQCFVHQDVMDNQKPVVLVDDEVTTGKTALNIIRNIHSKYPRKHYSVISILDWRSDEHKRQYRELEEELGICIKTTSLLAGRMEFEGVTLDTVTYDYTPEFRDEESTYKTFDISSFFTKSKYTNKVNKVHYIRESGRLGVADQDKKAIEEGCRQAAEYLSAHRTGKNTLCLGTGEFMYLPMKIAADMGPGTRYHSTTRSPVFPRDEEDYGVQNGFRFDNPEESEVLNFIYNIPGDFYDDVFVFFEREVTDASLDQMKAIFTSQGIKKMNFVIFSKSEGE
jgi:hypoxanthine-guanine phosphoribosyltransferase